MQQISCLPRTASFHFTSHRKFTWVLLYIFAGTLLYMFRYATVSEDHLHTPLVARGKAVQKKIVDHPIQKQSSSVNIALCMVGDIRSMVRADVQKNLHRAIYEPLQGARVDTFVHIGDNLIKGNAAIRAKQVNVSLLKFGDLPPKSISVLTVVPRAGAILDASTTCQTAGYAQTVRLRACIHDMLAFERSEAIRYDFVIRTRPDLEYFESLPPTKCWENLKPNIIWDMDTRFSAGLDKHNAHVVRPIEQVDFVGDWFTIVPRNLAIDVFSSIADDFEKCIPLRAPQAEKVCGEDNHRWNWSECRFKHAYHKTMGNVSVGKLMSETGDDFQWNTIIRCENVQCTKASRQKGQQHCHERKCNYKWIIFSPIGSDFKVRATCFPDAGYL